MTFTHAVSSDNFGCSKWIVDSSAANGTHTTIAAALTSASSGDTIFIRPGTYTENITLKAGVNLTAFGTDSSLNGTGKVIISGTCTMTTAGTATIYGIQLQTNSAALLAVTGSVASIVALQNCYLNCLNNTGITHSSSDAGSAIFLFDCNGNIGTTGIALITSTSAGNLNAERCVILNTGSSTTSSTVSTGMLVFDYCNLAHAFTTSSTGQVFFRWSQVGLTAQNTTALTTAGTGSSFIIYSVIGSGSASCVSVGTGTTVNIKSSSFSSSNTNVITGAGTFVNGGLFFSTGSSIATNATTQTFESVNLGKSFASGQPAFLAAKSATTNNATGNGASFTIVGDTEIYDVGSNYNNTTGTFTAPVTAKYLLSVATTLINCTIGTNISATITTTARTYRTNLIRAPSSNNLVIAFSQVCDMTAGDTATFQTSGFGEAGNTESVYGDGTTQGTWLTGYCLG